MEFNLEQLRDSYYEAICNLTEAEEIDASLPTSEYPNFCDLMEGIIERSYIELEYLNGELLEEIDPSMKEYLQEEIKICELRIRLCQKKITEALERQQVKEEIMPENNNERHLIFATTDSGRTYFERDLKSVPEETYNDVIACVEMLKNGMEESNAEKARAFSNNPKLSGLHEIKSYQTRLVYRKLTEDCVYVMLVRQKKDDNSQIDRESVISRRQATTAQFNQIKKAMEDPIKRDEIIRQNDEYTGTLLTQLKDEKRI